MHQHNGAIRPLRDSSPCLRYCIDGNIVVLGHGVAADEGIDHQHVDLARQQLGDQRFDHRRRHTETITILDGDAQPVAIRPAVEEHAVGALLLCHSMKQRCSGQLALQLR